MKRNCFKIIMVMFMPLTMLSGIAHAANFYADSAVAGMGNGTVGTPWKTLAQAVAAINNNTVKPGDTIYCRGAFVEEVKLSYKGTAADALAGRYITFSSWGAAIPVLTIPNLGNPADAAARYRNGFNFDHCYGVAVEGFDISAHRDRAIDSSGINASRSFFLRFRNNKIHDNGQSGIQTIRSGMMLIEGNQCSNNSWTSAFDGSGISVYQNFDYGVAVALPAPLPGTSPRTYQNTIRGNSCWGNANKSPNIFNPDFPDAPRYTDGNGIIVDDTNQTQNFLDFDPNERLNQVQHGGTVVENNICTENGGRGINIFKSSDVYVLNNTCHNNGNLPNLLPVAGAIATNDSPNTVLKNNIAYARTGQNAIEVYGALPTIQYNLVYNGPVCYLNGDQITLDNTNVTGDPKFGNPGGGNYYLQPTSPAIDNGQSTYAHTVDAYGNTRLQSSTVDMGALESNVARTYPAGSVSQYFEAESASTQSGFAPFSVVNDAGASGGKYITSGNSGTEWYSQYSFVANNVPALTGAAANHCATYTLPTSLTNQTTVNIWLRVRRVGFTTGVLFASIDGGLNLSGRGQLEYAYPPDLANSNFNETAWTWVKYRTVKLTAGSHSVKLAKGVNRVQIDRILVTSNLALQP
jgi:parallel beta-helix repeat protein